MVSAKVWKIQILTIIRICNSVNNHLTAYVHDKSKGSKGSKGGTDVAALLIDFVQQNFVRDGEASMRELNIITDNCAGQNRNRMAICTGAYMMETGMFSKVNLIF